VHPSNLLLRHVLKPMGTLLGLGPHGDGALLVSKLQMQVPALPACMVTNKGVIKLLHSNIDVSNILLHINGQFHLRKNQYLWGTIMLASSLKSF
jgi:hypothetical protein